WDVARAEPLTPPLPHSAGIKQAAFSPDGRHVLTVSCDVADRNGEVRVWLWPSAADSINLVQCVGSNVALSPDGRRAVAFNPYTTGSTTVGNPVPVWDVETGKPATTLRPRGPIRYAVFSSEGRYVATLSNGQHQSATEVHAQIWEAATGQPLGQ